MKKLITKLKKSKFIKNVAIMASGAIGAQMLNILLSPIITRIYGPEAFGLMGTFTSLVNVIIPVAAFTYPIAIVLPRNDDNAKGIITLSLFITSILSVFVLFFLLIFKSTIVNIFNLEEISLYLYLIPVVILLSGVMQVIEQWLIRKNEFSINARTTFYQSLITNGSKTGIGLFYPLASVLVVISAINNGVKALLMILLSKKTKKNATQTSKSNVNSEKKLGLLQLGKAYYDFPLYRAPETFLNAISQGLPVLMLTSFFGPTAAGFYTIGRTVLRIPGRIIGKAVGDVFYPKIAEAANSNENLSKIIKKATLLLAAIGIFPFGMVILVGPFLFSFVFGNNWIVAGEYARWLALWTFFGFINRPSVKSLPVLKAQKFHLIYTIFMLFIRVLALAIGYYLFSSDLIAVALFGISGALLNIGLIVVSLRISKRQVVFLGKLK